MIPEIPAQTSAVFRMNSLWFHRVKLYRMYDIIYDSAEVHAGPNGVNQPQGHYE